MRLAFTLCLALAAAPLWAQDAAPIDDIDVIRARAALFDGRVDEALAVIRPAAEAGNPRAQVLYGQTFELGEAGVQDAQQAIAWYEKAAAQGYPTAMGQLGVLYRRGAEGLDPDPVLAREWLARGVALDHIRSFTELGAMMVQGQGGPADPETGILLLERAAYVGDVDANADLGYFYALGLGVEQDEPRARRHFLAAAYAGNMSAQSNAGYMLAAGLGGPRDLELAEEMLRDSMAQGHDDAGVTMAEAILANPELGDGPLSAAAHCVWAFEYAAFQDGGDPGWDETCREVLAALTPAETAEAGRIAEKLVPAP